MPIFDFVTVPSLLIMAASPVCSMPKPLQIDIVPGSAPIIYDYSKGLKEMQNQRVDTVNPYDFKGETRTQGLMSGSLRIEPEVRIAYQTMPDAGAACLWYDTVSIKLTLAPTILLAREVYHDPCMRKAVMEHEMKHVNVDRQLVNKYSQIMGQRVYAELEQSGFLRGPMPIGDSKKISKEMQNTVFAIVTQEFKKLEVEQLQEQQKVDSLPEYERVNAMCPGFQKKYAVRKAYGD